MQGHTIKNKSDLVPDEIFGRRLLISLNADKNELKDNIRCARTLLSSFPDLNIEINAHQLKYRHKNPEYLINGLKADRKGILSPEGVGAGFRKSIEQGCRIIVIDLDKNLSNGKFRTKDLAKTIAWRHLDFEAGKIQECFVVFGGNAVKINSSFLSKDKILSELNKIKPR